MSTLLLGLMMFSIQGSFRIGVTFDGSWPAMDDEKTYSDLLNQGGVDYELQGMCWSGGVEALADVSSKVRVRGGFSVSRFHGTFSEELDPLSEALVGLLTGGLVFLFGTSDDDVVVMEDVATNIELAGYYKLTDGPTISVGGGPILAMASRSLDTPETSSSESSTAAGFTAAVRIDGEGGGFLGIPIVFGAEGGYRFSSITIDSDYSNDFSVDFSGPYVRLGTYLKL